MHGYLADRRSFYYQLNYFSRNFEVFAPDLKGFGENKGMDYPYALDDYISEVEEFKYKNSIVKPHIIAHSFGGRIAIKAAAENCEFCNKLVLTGAAGLKPKNTPKKAIKKALFSVLKKFVKKENLIRFYSKDYLALDGVMKESFKKIITEHLDGYLVKIKNKTLIVFGDKDKETPLYMARALNKGIADSRLITIKDAGHFCFIDKPNKFNLEVREFLLS
ncbi:MAG: alpha/beta hydrolase [Clostridia bacterium]|nr:alpha/beta hydrolase [Clostridia bacterium]